MLKYLSIPFEDKGNSFEGVNCWGLVSLFYKEEFGIEIKNFSNCHYKDQKKIKELIETKEGWLEVESDFMYGDVILFLIEGYESHVGIVLNETEMIHALKGIGVVIEDFISPLWKKRIKHIYRYDTNNK